MNDDQVRAMEQEVLRTPVDPETESQWASAAIEKFRSTESRLQAEWKMWRFLRDDDRMEALAAELGRVRSCIDYLDTVLSSEE